MESMPAWIAKALRLGEISFTPSGRTCRIALSKNSQQIAHQQGQQHKAKPYACAAPGTPPAVAKVSSGPCENEHQENNE
jgi:hypothetical protein